MVVTKKTKIFLCSMIAIFLNSLLSTAEASLECSEQQLSKHPERVLHCYLDLPETNDKTWVFNKRERYGDVTIETYTLYSQQWPKTTNTPSLLWQHTLLLYRPDEIKFNDALLFISGGIRYHKLTKRNLPSLEDLSFIATASKTKSIIINLKDVPNQYLKFNDNVPRKEDGIIAYTWNRYLDDPGKNAYWPAHLPMTKTVIKAMDAVQEITKDTTMPVENFIVTGASKRGWTTWLSLLSDARIKAVIPIVIDIFNMQKNIQHIHDTYNDWPIALKDYVEQGTAERFNSPEFNQLVKIEDPISYLKDTQCILCKQRLSKPKYIISASQDQFFPPDSLNYYVNDLPGETRVRMIPNQGHEINPIILIETLTAYYRNILNQISLPELRWVTNKDGNLQKVTTNRKPISVKLWQAENPNSRDFRYETGIRYSSQELQGSCQQENCEYLLDVPKPTKGWKAFFVEVSYAKPWDIILTTPAYIEEK